MWATKLAWQPKSFLTRTAVCRYKLVPHKERDINELRLSYLKPWTQTNQLCFNEIPFCALPFSWDMPPTLATSSQPLLENVSSLSLSISLEKCAPLSKYAFIYSLMSNYPNPRSQSLRFNLAPQDQRTWVNLSLSSLKSLTWPKLYKVTFSH